VNANTKIEIIFKCHPEIPFEIFASNRRDSLGLCFNFSAVDFARLESYISMTSPLESEFSSVPQKDSAEKAGWLRVGTVAMGSALVGGLLAAWWYRKTLSKLREAAENPQNPYFGIPAEDPADEA